MGEVIHLEKARTGREIGDLEARIGFLLDMIERGGQREGGHAAEVICLRDRAWRRARAR